MNTMIIFWDEIKQHIIIELQLQLLTRKIQYIFQPGIEPVCIYVQGRDNFNHGETRMPGTNPISRPHDWIGFEKIELHAMRNGGNGSRVADVASCNCGNESRFNRKINWYRSWPFPGGDIIKFFFLDIPLLSFSLFPTWSYVLTVYRPVEIEANNVPIEEISPGHFCIVFDSISLPFDSISIWSTRILSNHPSGIYRENSFGQFIELWMQLHF